MNTDSALQENRGFREQAKISFIPFIWGSVNYSMHGDEK